MFSFSFERTEQQDDNDDNAFDIFKNNVFLNWTRVVYSYLIKVLIVVFFIYWYLFLRFFLKERGGGGRGWWGG